VRIVVNDANILIDIVELKVLPYFFQLDFEFHTTELILEELFEEQREALTPYIETNRLIVATLSEDDFVEIINIRIAKPNLSEQDCSALYQAKKENAALITSDNALRKFAKSQNIEVHGHLWVFDMLVDKKILSGQRAIEKLNLLCQTVNPKLGLPGDECQKRIKSWKKLN
jgi:predicted nucleic acid-binding protein